MTIETQDDVVALKRVGGLASRVLQRMLDAVKPGMTTRDIDLIGEGLLRKHGARSAPMMTYGFPGSTCINVNEEVAHGIPGDRIIGAGDVLNVDVSAELGGYFADTGGTIVVPPATPKKTRLLRATRVALAEAIKSARAASRSTASAPPSSAPPGRMASGSSRISQAMARAARCTRSPSASPATSTLRTGASCMTAWSSPSSHSCRPKPRNLRGYMPFARFRWMVMDI